jgi:DNA-binding transcriptional LysR family regulator
MNIKALRAFRATMLEGSLVAASRAVHLSAPATSRLISQLEAQLRLTLFERDGRRLRPTAAGTAFFRDCSRILDGLDELPSIADAVRAGRQQALRVVAMPRVAGALVAPAVARFMAVEPHRPVRLDVRARREASHWLASREYDLAVGTLPLAHPEIETRPLLRVQAQVVMPRRHRLARRTVVTAQDLVDERVITLLPGLLLRTQLDDSFHSVGLQPSYACECASSQMACQLVSQGAGVALADTLTLMGLNAAGLVLRPFAPQRWMSFGLLLPARHALGPAAKRFIACVQQVARELADGEDSIEAL